MTSFNGPSFVDTVGNNPGTPLNAAVLNSLLLVQSSFLQSGGIPTSATSANPPVITQPATQAVINTGTACVPLNLAATTITAGGGSAAQDNYIGVDSTGVYHVTTVAAGTVPPPPAANVLRLYRATSGVGNVGIATFTDLANRNPLLTTGLLLADGGNAAPTVSLAGNLSVTGKTTLNNDILLNALLRTSGGPAVSAAFGAAAGTSPSGLVVTGDGKWGNVAFTTGTSPVTGTVLTLSCTPGGGQTLLGILVTGNLNSGGSARYIGQTVVSNSSGTWSVGVTVSNNPLVASTAYMISFMLLWA